MGNGRKQTALWLVFVEGAALSLGIYLLLTVLLSALVVKAVLPEEGSFPAVAASCCLASFAGAMLSVRRSSWGSLASAMVSAAGFLLAVVAVALLCWQQITWLGRGGVLLLCGAGGGLLAGLLGGRRRKRKRRPVRRGRKAEKPLVNFTKNTDLSPAAETAATVGRSPAAGETAAANVGRRPLLCLQDIVVFRGGGGDLSRRFYKVNIILFT